MMEDYMKQISKDYILKHVGVKGMKWGVRKKNRRPTSNESLESRFLRKEKAKRLTNQELQKVITRAELEARYNAINESSLSKGKKAIVSMLAKSGKAVLSTAITNYGNKLVKEIMDAKLGTG